MSKQKRTRDEAYAVVWEALNLAQDLCYLSDLCNPKNLKLSAKLSRKKLMKILLEHHELNVANTESAYALLEVIGEWADEYPLIKGENKNNPWTSRPLTEEDEEHYGLEGENK